MKRIQKKNSDEITINEAVELYKQGKIVATVYNNQISILHEPACCHWRVGFIKLSEILTDNCHSGSTSAFETIQRNTDLNINVFVFDNLTELIEYAREHKLAF